MLKKIMHLTIILFLIITSSSALAAANKYYPTGATLLKRCNQAVRFFQKKSYKKTDVFWCEGFLYGLYETHRYYSFRSLHLKKNINTIPKDQLNSLVKTHMLFCINTKTVTMREIAITVVNYLNARKDRISKAPAAFYVMDALQKKYPCSSS